MDKKRILVVDDENHILELIKYNMEQAGYEVHIASDGEKAVEMIESAEYDLLLLDLMLPGLSGMEICRKVRADARTRMMPVIMLTAKSSENDKIEGLEMGADDYIAKPFSINELKARIKALLRRSGKMEEFGVVSIGDLTLDQEKHEVTVGGETVDLTLKEYELLRILVSNPEKVLTRDVILDKVWGYEYFGDTRTVDVHIRHLRKKIGGGNGKSIETVRGVGYRMKRVEK